MILNTKFDYSSWKRIEIFCFSLTLGREFEEYGVKKEKKEEKGWKKEMHEGQMDGGHGME